MIQEIHNSNRGSFIGGKEPIYIFWQELTSAGTIYIKLVIINVSVLLS